MISEQLLANAWFRGQCIDSELPPTPSGWFELEANALLLSQAVEAAAVDAPGDTFVALAEMNEGLKEGLDEAIQGRGEELRRLNPIFQMALLLLLLAAIFQFAWLRQSERRRGFTSALGSPPRRLPSRPFWATSWAHSLRWHT